MLLKFLIIAVLVLLILKILTLPIRLGWKLLINTVCGYVCLVLINLLAPYTGILFRLNVLTAAIVGFLGLPGIILLICLHFIL